MPDAQGCDAALRTPAAPRPQAIAGVVALVLAGAVLIAGGPLLTTGVVGRATAAPLPSPPAVGTCVITDGPAGDAAGWRDVPCDTHHDAEVTAAWGADAPDRAGVDGPTCRGAADRYAGLADVLTVQDWTASVRTESRLVPAPDGQRAADRGWLVCTLAPASGERFGGSLAGRPFAAGPTPAFSRCTVDVGGGSAVPCSAPHRTELLGGAHGSYVPDAAEDADRPLPSSLWPDLSTGCNALAARLFDTPDPTYGGTVRIEVRPGLIGRNGAIGWYWSADCTVTVIGDRTLVGSLVGVGDHGVPFG
ncbi:MAG: hypothetical protein ABJA16_03905 [Nakamurella sp.]